MKQLFEMINKWADESFGKDRESKAIVTKLGEEVQELIRCVEGMDKQWNSNEDVLYEITDCIISLLNLTGRLGFKYEKLECMLDTKLAINMRRKYELLPDGTYRHTEYHHCKKCGKADITVVPDMFHGWCADCVDADLNS